MAGEAAVRLGVLISGNGTNLQALIDAVEKRELKAHIKIVISNRSSAYGLERARRHGIETAVIPHRNFATREDFDRELVRVLGEHEVELVACAGFTRLFSPVMLRAFPDRIMNIHPALLPSFPGLHVQKAAIEHGARFSGCTVFFVTEGTDEGPIIVQAVVPVLAGDDEQALAERILVQEHRIYPYAVALYQAGRLSIEGRRVVVKEAEDGAAGLAAQTIINPPIR